MDKPSSGVVGRIPNGKSVPRNDHIRPAGKRESIISVWSAIPCGVPTPSRALRSAPIPLISEGNRNPGRPRFRE